MAFSDPNDDRWKGPCYLEEIELALDDIPDSDDVQWITDAMNDDFWLPPGAFSGEGGGGGGRDRPHSTRETATAIAFASRGPNHGTSSLVPLTMGRRLFYRAKMSMKQTVGNHPHVQLNSCIILPFHIVTREPHETGPPPQRSDRPLGWLQSPLVNTLTASDTVPNAMRHIHDDLRSRDVRQPNDSFQTEAYSFQISPRDIPRGNHLHWPVALQANDPLARPSQHALLHARPYEAHGQMSPQELSATSLRRCAAYSFQSMRGIPDGNHSNLPITYQANDPLARPSQHASFPAPPYDTPGQMPYTPSPHELGAEWWHVSSTNRPGRGTTEMNEPSPATASLPRTSSTAPPLASVAGPERRLSSKSETWVDTPLITQFVQSNKTTRKKRNKAAQSGYVAPLTAYNFFFQFERQRLLAADAALDTPPPRLGVDQFSRHNADADPYAWILLDRVAFQDTMLHNQWSRDPSVKRKHCKSHGRISFEGLTRGIAQAWRGLDGSVKDVFYEIAARDSHRFQQETKLESTVLPRKRSTSSQRDPRGGT